jgi:hypothetical protein
MPTRGRLGACESCLKLSANRLDFWRVGQLWASPEGSESGGSFWQRARTRSRLRILRTCGQPSPRCSQRGHARVPSVRGRCGWLTKRGAAGAERGGQQLGRDAHLLRCSRETFLEKPRAGVAVRPEMSKFYCDGLTTSELQRARARTGRSWPLNCFLSLRARRAGGNRTKGNFTALLFVLH